MRTLIRRLRRMSAFTLAELLTVMAIIAILAALVLSVSGYATKKAALSRADAEVHALCAGCDSFKADNGSYPYQMLASTSGSVPTITGSYPNSGVPSDLLDSNGSQANGNSAVSGPGSPTTYTQASLELYQALTGDLSDTGTGGGPNTKNYIVDMKPDVWGRNNMTAPVSGTNTVYFLSDPFGNSYGYSTAEASLIATGASTPVVGYNPTYDLWSTGGQTGTPNSVTSTSLSGSAGDPMLQWVKNW